MSVGIYAHDRRVMSEKTSHARNGAEHLIREEHLSPQDFTRFSMKNESRVQVKTVNNDSSKAGFNVPWRSAGQIS